MRVDYCYVTAGDFIITVNTFLSNFIVETACLHIRQLQV